MTRDQQRARRVLKQAILKVGTQAEFARKLKISPQRLAAWNRVPFKFIRKASKISGIAAKKFVPEVG